MILLLEGPTGPRRVELIRGEPSLAAAIVCGVRDVERAGQRVVCLQTGPQAPGVLAAADLILRLRGMSAALSEEEMAVLFDLLAF